MSPLIIFLFNIFFVKAVYFNFEEDYETRKSLSQCVSTASKFYFNAMDVVTISIPTVEPNISLISMIPLDQILINELHYESKWSVLIKKANVETFVPKNGQVNARIITNGYIIQIKPNPEIELDLKELRHNPSWNPHGKFIIVSSNYLDSQPKILKELVQKLWKFNILNGVILLPVNKGSKIYNVFAWYPFANGRCGNNADKIEVITQCSYGLMSKREPWFDKKIPDQLNGCPVKVRTQIYPPYVMDPVMKVDNATDEYVLKQGMEIKLLNLVAKVMNITLHFSMSGEQDDFGYCKGLKTRGILGLLCSEDMDIGVGSFSASSDRYLTLDATTAYFQDSLNFCVPHSIEKAQWQKLSEILSLPVWIAIITTMFLIIIITKFLAKNSNDYEIYSDSGNITLKVIAISLSNSINLQPKTGKVRTFLLIWIIFSLYLGTAYQTLLTSSLTDLQYEHQIKTVQQILDNGLEILFLNSSRRYFFNVNDEPIASEIRAILAKWKVCNDMEACLNRTAHKKDCSIIASKLFTSFVRNDFESKTGPQLLYCFEHNFVSYPIVMYMRRGFPLKNRIDDIINRINAAGLINMWEKNLFAKKISLEGDEKDYKNDVLRLKHLKSIFLLLVVGSVGALVVLGCEILCHRF